MSGSGSRRRQRIATFRCTDREIAEIVEAAGMVGKSPADFVLEAAMDRVIEVGMASTSVTEGVDKVSKLEDAGRLQAEAVATLREQLRRRATISLGGDALRRFLDLPADLTVVSVHERADPPGIVFVVAGPSLAEVPGDTLRAPELGGGFGAVCYMPEPTEDEPNPPVYRRFVWSQATPRDREEEMLAYIFRLRHQVQKLAGPRGPKPVPWPAALKPRLIGLADD